MKITQKAECSKYIYCARGNIGCYISFLLLFKAISTILVVGKAIRVIDFSIKLNVDSRKLRTKLFQIEIVSSSVLSFKNRDRAARLTIHDTLGIRK